MALKIESLGDGVELEGQGTSPTTLKITELRPAVKDTRRVNVFINGHYECSLDVAQVVDLGLKRGQSVTTEELIKLQQASEFGKVYQRALEWALARPRSLREMQDYLHQRQIRRRQLNHRRKQENKRTLAEIDDAMISAVKERLRDKGYVDDQKFAEFWVNSRQNRKGTSERKLRLELQRKGVTEETIEEVLSQSSHDDANEIRRLIRKKARRYDQMQLINYLVRQGFDYDLVRKMIAEAKEELKIE